MKYTYALVLTACYVALLLIFYIVHVWYFPVHVVLYSALIDAVLAAVIVGAGLFVLRPKLLPFNVFESLLLVGIWLLGGYAFAISVPTVLDRSLSFYILEKLQQRGGGIEQARIADVFTDEYLPEFRLVDVRLTEQVESGTIVIRNGCVILTERGERLASFSRFVRQNLMPRKRLLAGEYTDALLDPFANSAKGKIGYECR
jgi:hypothetical protein